MPQVPGLSDATRTLAVDAVTRSRRIHLCISAVTEVFSLPWAGYRRRTPSVYSGSGVNALV